MRKLTAGCLGALAGAVTVIWAEVHYINAGIKEMDERQARAIARALHEGPSQAEYDGRCAGAKRQLDATRTLECERMEYYMQRAKERKAREAAGAAASTTSARPPG